MQNLYQSVDIGACVEINSLHIIHSRLVVSKSKACNFKPRWTSRLWSLWLGIISMPDCINQKCFRHDNFWQKRLGSIWDTIYRGSILLRYSSEIFHFRTTERHVFSWVFKLIMNSIMLSSWESRPIKSRLWRRHPKKVSIIMIQNFWNIITFQKAQIPIGFAHLNFFSVTFIVIIFSISIIRSFSSLFGLFCTLLIFSRFWMDLKYLAYFEPGSVQGR